MLGILSSEAINNKRYPNFTELIDKNKYEANI